VKTDSHRRFHTAPLLLVLACAVGQSPGFDDAPAGVVRLSALQSCPAVEEEIVDLEVLATGLRASQAVGLIEKIRLKSAIDDLIERMQAYHDGKSAHSLFELQEQYDVLLMRIAAHLQHKDQILHGQLCNAWELIWRDLEDPEHFAEKFL
jgi:hypothetical protein